MTMTYKATIKKDTWFKLKPEQSAVLSKDEKRKFTKGQKVGEFLSWSDVADGHVRLEVAKDVFVYTWRPDIELDDPRFNTPISFLSREQLGDIAVNVSWKRVDAILAPINAALVKYEINTPLRICHFLAQIAHESDGFNTNEEYASGADYEWREDLGNIYEGDGRKFKGRSFIQVTGRANYQELSNYLGIDLISNPELLGTDELAPIGAGWFWSTRNLNAYADADDFDRITCIINGGYTGYEDRLNYLTRAKQVFGI